MVSLLGLSDPGLLVDPACGIGSTLWAAESEMRTRSIPIRLVGIEINGEVAEAARAMAAVLGVEAEISQGDALRSIPECRYIVCQPPLGLRLRDAVALTSVDGTRDGELAFVDRCCSALLPGGRAVLQLGRGWLFRRGDAGRVREWLSDRFHVVSIIGLPSGAVAGTAIPSCLVVIDAAAPGPTLVADLDDDWQQQLSDGGAFLAAFREHTEGGVG
jgi:type I restriction-modification system DNA methylase subunit